jgi:hypothetical protein
MDLGSNLPNQYYFSPLVEQPLLGQDLIVFEASRSHSDTSDSVRLIWTSNQSDAKIST